MGACTPEFAPDAGSTDPPPGLDIDNPPEYEPSNPAGRKSGLDGARGGSSHRSRGLQWTRKKKKHKELKSKLRLGLLGKGQPQRCTRDKLT